MIKNAVRCQNCRKPNSLSRTHCAECGTRLLLLVLPNSLQYDTNQVPTFYEDHLLERVTLLEMQLAQTVERLETAYAFIQRCLETFEKDHIALKSFLETIGDLSPQLAETISRRNTEIYRGLKREQAAGDRKKRVLGEIRAEHAVPNAELFTHLVAEGIALLERGEEKQGFQTLERAALLSPHNAALGLFIAENLFRADQPARAKTCLEKAFGDAPVNPKVLLLLGAILADEGDADRARRSLSLIINHEKAAPVVNLIWGMLAAGEENWPEAVAAFKQAAAAREDAELEYLIGCGYFAMRQTEAALGHLHKAAALDPQFSDAWFMQAVVYRFLNQKERGKNALEKAHSIKEGGADFLKYKKSTEPGLILPFAHLKKKGARVMTGGALRLTKFFRENVLRAIE